VTGCPCPVPRPRQANPNFPHRDRSCQRCGKVIDQRFVSSDSHFQKFFGWLADTPGVEQEFIEHCRVREGSGRGVFGLAYLNKDNPREAMEEACDMAIYCYLHLLRQARDGADTDPAMALEVAQLAGKAWSLLRRMA
jgi:hypothetical protein